MVLALSSLYACTGEDNAVPIDDGDVDDTSAADSADVDTAESDTDDSDTDDSDTDIPMTRTKIPIFGNGH